MWYMGREILDWILEDLGEPKEMVNVFIMEVVCWSVTLRFSVIVQGAYSTFKEREQSHRGMFNRLGRATKSWRWTGFAMFLQSGFRIPQKKVSRLLSGADRNHSSLNVIGAELLRYWLFYCSIYTALTALQFIWAAVVAQVDCCSISAQLYLKIILNTWVGNKIYFTSTSTLLLTCIYDQ